MVPQPHRLPELTDSELRLLPLLATPLSFAEIARLLGAPRDEILADALVITKRAVEGHINAIFAKLKLGDSDDVSRRVKAALVYLTGT